MRRKTNDNNNNINPKLVCCLYFVRWNPYRGVLGVWSGWKVDITNNAFKSMLMTDGDDCGSTGPRQVRNFPWGGEVMS